MIKRVLTMLAAAAALSLVACGGAEVTADDDPGDEPADFKTGVHGDLTEGDIGADVDISEGDEHEIDD